MASGKLGRDLLLDPDTGDLRIENGDLVLGVDIAQAINIQLRWLAGEWFRDTRLGIEYFTHGKNPDVDYIAAQIRTAISETPQVAEVTRFVYSLDARTRKLSVDWAAITDDGESVAGAEVL